MKNEITKLWRRDEWFQFSERVKKRDGYKCFECSRTSKETTLQVHHELYIKDRKPWEYPLSDCRTLCKGCHAREHDLIEPNRGWTLLSDHDLGDIIGECEREGCGTSIRYEHQTYHPEWGYKIVGSTCIEHLTREDRELSAKILHMYKLISKFVHNSIWEHDYSYEGQNISTKYGHDKIRVYGNESNYSFQIFVRKKGSSKFIETKVISAKDKTFEEIKELSYVVLKGKSEKDPKEKEKLRELYRGIR